jgi:parallel beta-helix repeat protein
MKAAWLVGMLVGVVLAGPAVAATIQVPKDYETIQEAVDAAENGDTILVKKATYAEIVVIKGFEGLTLIGKGRPTIDGGNEGIPLSILGSSDVMVSGFVIQNSSDHGVYMEECQDCTITKCLVRDTDESGIVADDSQRITITKNKIQDTGEDGIALSDDAEFSTDDCLVEKNKIQNTGDDGLDVTGSRNKILKNSVKNAGGDGFDFDGGTENRFEKNKVTGCHETGFLLDSDTNTILKNKVVKPGDDGIALYGGDDQVEKNKVVKAGYDGFYLDSTGNTLRKNKASGSRVLDLEDAEPGTNDIDDSNKFKTTNQ